MRAVRYGIVAVALTVAGCAATGPVARTQSTSKPATADADALAAYQSKQAADPKPYDALIARYAAEYGVPLPLAHAVVEKESGYNAKATGRGTVGLMQIKPATARGIGYTGSTAGLYDPATNLRWGMKYLGTAYELGGGDVCGTALRYQGGHRATRSTPMTEKYCAHLKAIMAKNGARA
ncbi:MAG TPA: transglycosylase SLT domain-containing protein [Propylenella sp.]|nr:transglycosylase SLT domain-containing protein [Propylenella sp.]